MKRRNIIKSTLAVLFLSLSIVVTYLPASTITYATDGSDYGETVATLAFSSDVHNMTNNISAERLRAWIDNVEGEYGDFDVMSFCGDFADSAVSESLYWQLTQADMDVADERVDRVLCTTGNHEYQPGNYDPSSGDPVQQRMIINAEGAADEHYHIYVLGSESRSSAYSDRQIAMLGSYLDSVGNDSPIFIITHYPLHTYRSRSTTNANRVITVLNNAALANDQKIVFLWGHNHTESDPSYDYIYKPGETIQCGGRPYDLEFYYAAAGCMSDGEYGTGGGANVRGKGLVVNISDKNLLKFTYYSDDAIDVTEGGAFTESEPVAPTGISIDEATGDDGQPVTPVVKLNKTLQLHTTLEPEGASVRHLEWSTSDDSIASVDSSGLVSGVSEGTATITVTVPDTDITASVEVEVRYEKEATYVPVDKLVDGGEYLIVNTPNVGTAYALKNPGGTSSGVSVENSSYRSAVEINEEGCIETNDTDIVWTATSNAGGFNLTNGSDYLEGLKSRISVFNPQVNSNRYWTYRNKQLQHNGGDSTYTLGYNNSRSYFYGNNTTGNSNRVYLYGKRQHDHTLAYFGANDAGCETDGNSEYWYCSECDKYYGDSLGINAIEENSWVIPALGHETVTDAAVEPTCTEPGKTEGSHCSRCNEVFVAQETIDALGHEYQDVEGSASEPTCAKAGKEIDQKCSRCGDVITGAEIPALGHIKVIDAGVEPTCTEAGLTEGSHCSRCNEVLVAQETIEALGHNYEDEEGTAIEATCTTAGKKADKKCSRCGDEVIGAEIPALGHEEVTDEAVEPTCTTEGKTEGSHCSRCNEVLVAQETIDALGHKEVTDEAVEPTCTTEGKTEGSHCSRCNEVLVAQETIEALGHDPVTDAAVEPTCTETGLTEGSHCSRCNEVLVAQETVDALGHEYEEVPDSAVAPTCTTAGKKADKKCSRCGDEIAGAEIEALGHDPVTDAAVEPTCTETGLTEGSHCSRCNEVLVAQETVKALGHDPVADAAVEPTCTETGLTEGSHCSRCNEVLVAQETIEALGHDPVVDAAVEPTCTETGLTEGSHCARCNEVLVAQETVKALGHDVKLLPAVPATCTETGLTAGSYCSRCNEVLVAQETVKALGHEYEDVPDSAVAPTCTTAGKKADKKCTRCGDEIIGEEIPALGHKEVTDEAVAPTCTDTGLTEGSHCSRCNEVLVAQETVKALGHDPVKDKAVAPTCTETGLTEGSHCSRCNEVLVAQETIEALGHDPVVDAAVEPTCTETGLTEGSHCARCNEVLVAQETVKALGHDVKLLPAVPATCTETGLTAGSYCSRCNEVLIAQETVKALGHEYEDVPDSALAPTCTAAGKKADQKCTRCGDEVIGAELPALGHKEVTDEAVAPTCTDTGLTEGSHCSRCNEVLVAQETVKALGHDPVTDAAVGPTCTETGLTEGSHCSRCNEVLVAQETVGALGHDAVTDAAVGPTCTETGLTEGSHCSRCNEVLVAQETVDALGHDPVTDAAVGPTCTETGLTEGSHCSRCNEVLVAQETVDALGHDPVTDKAVAPTCTKTGLTEGSHCSRCNEVLVAQETVDALGHDWDEWVTVKEATEEEEGLKERTCRNDPTHKESEVIPKIEKAIGGDGTPAGKGASYSIADEAIREAASEEGPAGTKFSQLRLKTTKQTSSSISLKWTKVKGAEKYVIYGARCGKSMRKLSTSTLDAKVIKKIGTISLKSGIYYKFIVVALDGNDKVVSTSKVIHVVTKGGAYGNYSKVTVSKTIVTRAQALKVGNALSLRAKAVKASGVKVRTHRVLSYESSNTKIATVSSKGVIRARAKGTCYVCAYTQDGIYKRIKVVVK